MINIDAGLEPPNDRQKMRAAVPRIGRIKLERQEEFRLIVTAGGKAKSRGITPTTVVV